MKRIVILIVLFFGSLLVSKAQDFDESVKAYELMRKQRTPNFEHNHRLGVNYSQVSAFGLSYQYYLSNAWRINFSGYLFNSETKGDLDFDDRNRFNFALGTQLNWIFFDSRIGNLYALAGAGFGSQNDSYTTGQQFYQYQDRDVSSFRAGLGIGSGLYINEALMLDLEVGYGYFSVSETFDNSDPKTRYKITFALGIGLHFCF